MDIIRNPSYSHIIKTEIVSPNDTNYLHNLHGGRILHWMDETSAISAGKHAGAVVVTASVDHVSFKNPIRLGDVVVIEAVVTRAFKTSIETYITVHGENAVEGIRYKSNEAFFTLVAIDKQGKPIEVPPLVTETEQEKERYEKAQERRELRLLLAGRMEAKDSAYIQQFVKIAGSNQ